MSAAWALDAQLDADTAHVASLALCEVRLMRDSNHPWLVLVPRVAGAVELIDLPPDARTRLGVEVDHAARALRAGFAPDKLNVAALGNVVAQLHVHVVARFRSDVAWPRPVWGAAPAAPYDPAALRERIARLVPLLGDCP